MNMTPIQTKTKLTNNNIIIKICLNNFINKKP